MTGLLYIIRDKELYSKSGHDKREEAGRGSGTFSNLLIPVLQSRIIFMRLRRRIMLRLRLWPNGAAPCGSGSATLADTEYATLLNGPELDQRA
jgi:hypothetical protein